MKKRSIIMLACAMLAVFVLLAGCIGSNSDYEPDYSAPPGDTPAGDSPRDEQLYDGLFAQNMARVTGGGSAEPERYVVAKAKLDLQTKQYDELNKDINAKLKELNGYIENKSEHNYDSGRYQSLVVRVPSGKLDAFLNGLEKNATVTQMDVSYTDVTDEMIETGSRKKALEAEEKALLDILKKAQSIDEIITVQDRLSKIKSELESYILKLQKLKNQVNYSTVNMDIREVERIVTPTQSFSALAGSGFMNSLKNVGAGLRDFAIWFIGAIPYFVLIAVIAVPVVIAVKKLRKRRTTSA